MAADVQEAGGQEPVAAIDANLPIAARLDGRIFEGTRKDTLRIKVDGRRMVLRDDWTGTVERVNTALLRLLIEGGYFPVLTPPGASTAGEAINVDGDRAAAMVAGMANVMRQPGQVSSGPRTAACASSSAFSPASASLAMATRVP